MIATAKPETACSHTILAELNSHSADEPKKKENVTYIILTSNPEKKYDKPTENKLTKKLRDA